MAQYLVQDIFQNCIILFPFVYILNGEHQISSRKEIITYIDPGSLLHV